MKKLLLLPLLALFALSFVACEESEKDEKEKIAFNYFYDIEWFSTSKYYDPKLAGSPYYGTKKETITTKEHYENSDSVDYYKTIDIYNYNSKGFLDDRTYKSYNNQGSPTFSEPETNTLHTYTYEGSDVTVLTKDMLINEITGKSEGTLNSAGQYLSATYSSTEDNGETYDQTSTTTTTYNEYGRELTHIYDGDSYSYSYTYEYTNDLPKKSVSISESNDETYGYSTKTTTEYKTEEGRITSKTISYSVDATESSYYTAQEEYIQSKSVYTYDGNGHVVKVEIEMFYSSGDKYEDRLIEYEVDSEGRPVSEIYSTKISGESTFTPIKKTEYSYDAKGRRLKTTRYMINESSQFVVDPDASTEYVYE